MPNPFPGMNPYLEDPQGWGDFHHSSIIYTRAALVPQLPPDYAARVEERVYFVPRTDRQIIPDSFVVHRPALVGAGHHAAVAAADYDPPVVLTISPVEIRELYIEIYDLRKDQRVVTVIEILSPTNKAPNSRGRQLYNNKQRQLLESQTHLVEIDLLRDGEYTIAAPQEVLREESRWDYLTCLHRGNQAEVYEVWPISLRERLPRVAVPLDVGVRDMSLDLQAILERCYDEGGYEAQIDYTRPAVPPLQGDDLRWADSLLRAHRANPE